MRGQAQAPEAIGQKTVAGLLCDGTRTTFVWPVGSRGNDRPISVVSEIWKSSELQFIVATKINDPQNGERTQTILSAEQTEPAAELFKPPADFKVVEDTDNDAFPIGNGVAAPSIVSKVEPEYSEEARHAGISGSVLLSIVIGVDGVPTNIKVVRSLGLA